MLDLASDFHQIEIDEKDVETTTCRTENGIFSNAIWFKERPYNL